MKGSAWFETLAANFMFLYISSTNRLQNYRKLSKQQNFYRKKFQKSCVRGHNLKEEAVLLGKRLLILGNVSTGFPHFPHLLILAQIS